MRRYRLSTAAERPRSAAAGGQPQAFCFRHSAASQKGVETICANARMATGQSKEFVASSPSRGRPRHAHGRDNDALACDSSVISSSERKALIRSLARLTRDADSAEECFQTAFVRLEEYRQRRHVESDVRFLARAARNIAIDEARKSRVRANAADEIRQLLEDYQNDQPLQDEVLMARERLSRARAVLESLPERTLTVFQMHRFARSKHREIAVELEISVSAVEKHIARASLALAESFDQEESA